MKASRGSNQGDHASVRVVIEVTVAAIGLALIAAAIAADRRWLDRHFLPPFFAPRIVYVLTASLARMLVAAVGLTLAFVARPRIGRFAARTPPATLAADALRVALAVALALGVSELTLRHTVFGLAAQEMPTTEEPSRQRNGRLGWVFVPARTGRDTVGGRTIEYVFDAAGYRVQRADRPVDPLRPTIVFTGESVMVGQGLTWGETIPAQVEALLGIQSANIAVHGYATDQAYMRLVAELPRFRQPVAVVLLFAPALFDRNLDQDRPHLGPDLTWLPPERRTSLAELLQWFVPYRSDAAIARGITATRAVLRATIDLARSRGATPIILVPQFAAEDPTESVLRRRILDDTQLPYVRVALDPSWRVPHDRHPDARAAHAMALAAADRLQPR
jgi:hypothetical protein